MERNEARPVLEEHPYLALAAEGKNDWRRYVLTIILCFVVSIVTQVAALIAAMVIRSLQLSSTNLEVLLNVNLYSPSLYLFVVGSAFVGIPLLVAICQRWLHRRSFHSLLTARVHFDWRIFGAAAGLWALLCGLGDLVLSQTLLRGQYQWQFDLGAFLPYTLVTLLLIPIQISSEELIFRGYLTQGIGRLTKLAWVPFVVTSLIFASLHLANPEVEKYGMLLTLPGYIGIGLLLAWLVWKTYGLEAALGVHLANNLYATLMVTFPASSLPGPALFYVKTFDPLASLIVQFVQTVIFVAAFLWLYRLWSKPGSH